MQPDPKHLSTGATMGERVQTGGLTRAAVAALIDHTLLRPEATASSILKLCDEARSHGFASVCLNPYWVELAAGRLEESPVKVCTVIGFPLGANMTAIKVAETEAAIRA